MFALLSRTSLLNISPKEHRENSLQRGYRRSLQWVLKHRLVTLVTAVLLLVASVVFIAPQLGTTFLPQERVSNYDVSISTEKGTLPEDTSNVASKVENILLDQDEIELVSTSVNGQSEFASISFVIKDSVENVDGFIEDLRDQFGDIKEAKEISVTGVGGLVGGEESNMLVVNGSNIEDIKTASQEIVAVKKLDGMAEISFSLEGEEPEIEIDLNEDKLRKRAYASNGWSKPSQFY